MASTLTSIKRRDQDSQNISNLPLENVSVSGESVSIPAGAAGSVVTARLKYGPILDAVGIFYGGDEDTSLVLTSTAFTNEVTPRADSALANGDFWVDYTTGVIRGKKADTSTSATAAYLTRRLYSSSTASGGATPVEGNVASGATDSGNPVLIGGVFTTSDPTYTNNQRGRLRIDDRGYLLVRDGYVDRSEDDTNMVRRIGRPKLSVSTYSSPINAVSGALEASRVIKASAGTLERGYIEVDQSAPTGRYYILFVNATAVPVDGAVTTFWPSITVEHTNGVTDRINIDNGDDPMYYSSGCVILISTTQFTKTISGAYLKMGIKAA